MRSMISRPKNRPLGTRISDWRVGKVTVCIAAFAEDGKRIVMVSDSKVAFGDFSADSAVQKNIPLSPAYNAMVAGNDIAYAGATLSRIKKRIEEDETVDPDEVADIVHEELAETRRKKIEARILSKFGYTTETFRTEGKNTLSDSAFYDILSKIDKEDLSLKILINGFDENQEAHIRIVSADDTPEDWDMIGFAAIGTGAVSALSSLSFAVDHCGFSRYDSIEDVSYHVLAAKFMSESATDVGRDTFYVSVNSDPECTFMYSKDGFDIARKLWEVNGAPRRSAETIEAIKNFLFPWSEDLGSWPPKSADKWARIREYYPEKVCSHVDKLIESMPLDSQMLEGQQSPCDEEYPQIDSSNDAD